MCHRWAASFVERHRPWRSETQFLPETVLATHPSPGQGENHDASSSKDWATNNVLCGYTHFVRMMLSSRAGTTGRRYRVFEQEPWLCLISNSITTIVHFFSFLYLAFKG